MRYLARMGEGKYVQLNREDCVASASVATAETNPASRKITETFQSLTDHIRSVYHLNYSSQQTHGNTSLSLQLHIDDQLMDTLTLPADSIASD